MWDRLLFCIFKECIALLYASVQPYLLVMKDDKKLSFLDSFREGIAAVFEQSDQRTTHKEV